MRNKILVLCCLISIAIVSAIWGVVVGKRLSNELPPTCENKSSENIDSIEFDLETIVSENIIYLPENTIIKQVYMMGGKETYLLEDTVQNIYEKCYLMEDELVSEIIFMKN